MSLSNLGRGAWPDLIDLRPDRDPARTGAQTYGRCITEEAMTTSHRMHMAAVGAVVLGSMACSGAEPPPPAPPPLPAAALQRITEELVTRSGAPGAIVGVVRGDRRWIGAAGSEDLDGSVPMPAAGIFRAASITKMFTATLVLEQVEAGALSPEAKLAAWSPSFPNAAAITLDELLSHTAGVTTLWFDQPALQAVVTKDLAHLFTPAEALSILSQEPPFGAPGASGMQYSNTDYVLLGDVLTRVTGAAVGDLMRQRIFDTVPLPHTTYQFAAPPGLVSGWYEYQGLTLDMSTVPQEALVSFAGAAGAVHTTADDLLTFADALFRQKRLLGESSLGRMTTPAEDASWYAHGLMRFCPCDGGPGSFTGWGHAGNLPGYWSEVVYYPDRDVIVVAMINRDMVHGVMLDHTVFDPTLEAVLEAVDASK
jgi:D-alanyl-D-alanine carboxypeptidase